jgi:hypothetical protein
MYEEGCFRARCSGVDLHVQHRDVCALHCIEDTMPLDRSAFVTSYRVILVYAEKMRTNVDWDAFIRSLHSEDLHIPA